MSFITATRRTLRAAKSSTVGVASAVLIVSNLVLEANEIVFLLIGVCMFALLSLNTEMKRNMRKMRIDSKLGHTTDHTTDHTADHTADHTTDPKIAPPRRRNLICKSPANLPPAVKSENQHQRQTPQSPVTLPPVSTLTLSSVGWEAQVEELVGRIVPTAADEKIVQRLVALAEQAIHPLIPEAEVVAFANSGLSQCKAFGVAVPDVEMIINANPTTLLKSLRNRFSQGGFEAARNDPRKLQKSAIRACTDQLVLTGGFKFRRSAFRREDPKVTIVAPVTLGASRDPIALDLTVNSATPFQGWALLTECGQIEPRAKELMILIKHWARDRGISHGAKGHLSPYAWSVLAMYFLQVGMEDDAPLLPPFKDFQTSSALSGQSETRERKTEKVSSPMDNRKSVGTLFKEFVRFYNNHFDWQTEMVSVRNGERSAPTLQLPLHIIVNQDGTSQVGLNVEDPFEPRKNLGDTMTDIGLLRLKEELTRAEEFCAREASLVEMLEHWVPPTISKAEESSDN